VRSLWGFWTRSPSQTQIMQSWTLLSFPNSKTSHTERQSGIQALLHVGCTGAHMILPWQVEETGQYSVFRLCFLHKDSSLVSYVLMSKTLSTTNHNTTLFGRTKHLQLQKATREVSGPSEVALRTGLGQAGAGGRISWQREQHSQRHRVVKEIVDYWRGESSVATQHMVGRVA
jgi:hypothetical protein